MFWVMIEMKMLQMCSSWKLNLLWQKVVYFMFILLSTVVYKYRYSKYNMDFVHVVLEVF